MPRLCCCFFSVLKLTNLINHSFEFWMIMSSFRLKAYFTRSFQHSVSILTNIFFLQHLLKIRIIPSPVTHKQTKTTQQQIHSHLKKVHVSRFPVVSNEAIQDLNSVAVNKHTNSSHPLKKTVKERTSSEASASSDPAILQNKSWNKRHRKNLTRSWV